MLIKRLLPILLIAWLMIGSAAAQEQTNLSLQAVTTQMQTGQEYEINVRLDNVPSLWLASVEIRYDPNKLYVIGTKSGSPVRTGDLFAPETSVVVFNQVEQQRVRYTISEIAPAKPITGSGVIGTFRVYPLSAGTTTLTFRQAELLTVDEQGGSKPVSFQPVLLELTISGDTVEPPPEATATPAPTETTFFVPGATQPPQPTALVNVTAAPVTPTPTAAPQADNTPLLAIAIGAMVIGLVGLVIVLILWQRSRRSR